MSLLKNKILGTFFGQAIGDALGLGAEFLSKEEVKAHYPNGLHSYDQIIQDNFRSRWQKGAWTDDTDQMLCIANAIIKDKDINQLTVAQELYSWIRNGPADIGTSTYQVLSHPQYATDPERAAEWVWDMSYQRSAANGAVMRTSIIGLWDKETIKKAEDICKITHYDPRCVGSCVIVSMLINRLIHGQSMTADEMIGLGRKYDNRIEEYINLALSEDIESLQLDGTGIGYTLKTLSAGLWVYFHCADFESGLIAVVNAGGDADTNGAVACAILGAKFGYDNIPQYYIDNLVGKEHLYDIAIQVFDLVNG
ncbi:ADP-ribosylglycohydrolase family protein [Alistipes sp. OttesenSCG-928-B03]|nr:ADP-ribosylglycohydrolase family protein [Alistipes sp. OttesenSCG-928-B03]